MEERIAALVEQLLAGGPVAHGKVKELVRAVAARPIDAAIIADTAKRIAEMRASPGGKEGIAAFLEKRKPSWTKK